LKAYHSSEKRKFMLDEMIFKNWLYFGIRKAHDVFEN